VFKLIFQILAIGFTVLMVCFIVGLTLGKLMYQMVSAIWSN
jgi:hypothetical protein